MSKAWNFVQIGYNEGIFSLNLGGIEVINKIIMTLQPKVRASEDEKDVLALQLSVVYSQPDNDKTLAEYGGIAIFRVSDLLQIYSEKETTLDFKRNFLSMGLGFFRGIIWEKLKGTGLERFLLPQMSEEEMMEVEFPSIEELREVLTRKS